jgi:hypothetical protein
VVANPHARPMVTYEAKAIVRTKDSKHSYSGRNLDTSLPV